MNGRSTHPMSTRAVLALAAWLCAGIGSAHSATFRVDDSASLPADTSVAMKWQSLAPTRAASHLVEGATLVTVRLNLAPWVNKTGKIYMALAHQPVGLVSAEWSTQGILLPGQLNSGSRTLVYAGPVRSARLEDTIALKILTDGRRLSAPQRLNFYFEIDVD